MIRCGSSPIVLELEAAVLATAGALFVRGNSARDDLDLIDPGLSGRELVRRGSSYCQTPIVRLVYLRASRNDYWVVDYVFQSERREAHAFRRRRGASAASRSQRSGHDRPHRLSNCLRRRVQVALN